MTAWLRNLRLALDQYPIVVLHGNVRDAFLELPGSVHGDLVSLLESVLVERGFERLTLYGGDSQVVERDLTGEAAGPRTTDISAPDDAVSRLCRDLALPEDAPPFSRTSTSRLATGTTSHPPSGGRSFAFSTFRRRSRATIG